MELDEIQFVTTIKEAIILKRELEQSNSAKEREWARMLSNAIDLWFEEYGYNLGDNK